MTEGEINPNSEGKNLKVDDVLNRALEVLDPSNPDQHTHFRHKLVHGFVEAELNARSNISPELAMEILSGTGLSPFVVEMILNPPKPEE